MKNEKLNKLIDTLAKEVKEDIERRVTVLEKNYASDINQIGGAVDEVRFQMHDWKRTMESLEEDINKECFTVTQLPIEPQLEIINHMDSVLERELGKFGYVSIFKTEEEVEQMLYPLTRNLYWGEVIDDNVFKDDKLW